mgnify:CR=1 FL=1
MHLLPESPPVVPVAFVVVVVVVVVVDGFELLLIWALVVAVAVVAAAVAAAGAAVAVAVVVEVVVVVVAGTAAGMVAQNADLFWGAESSCQLRREGCWRQQERLANRGRRVHSRTNHQAAAVG